MTSLSEKLERLLSELLGCMGEDSEMPNEGPNPKGLCWPQCIWFKCGKHALQIRTQTLWCRWINDNCTGSSCSFSFCVRGKMLPQNRCGLVVRRVTQDRLKPEDFEIDVKLGRKITRRLRDVKDIV